MKKYVVKIPAGVDGLKDFLMLLFSRGFVVGCRERARTWEDMLRLERECRVSNDKWRYITFGLNDDCNKVLGIDTDITGDERDNIYYYLKCGVTYVTMEEILKITE